MASYSYITGVGIFTGWKTENGFGFALPIPKQILTPNGRGHWMKKSQAVKRYRRDTGLLVTSTLNGFRVEPPRWEKATAYLRFYYAKNRARDEDNALASMKAGFDGLADAGLILNDSGLSPRIEFMTVDCANPRVEVIVEPIGGAHA